MIISIRGTNGAGKSTVMRAVMAAAATTLTPIYRDTGTRLPEAYQMTIPGVADPVYVLGSYTTSQQGGCDLIKPYDLILTLIERYAAQGHVLFEGVLVSSSNGRVGTLMEKWGQESVMLFLTTSLEECIRRVKARREDMRNKAVFNPANLTDKYNSVRRSLEVIRGNGKVRVEEASSDEAPALILSLLRSAKRVR